jgi:O-antigen/teichoic acid export membrane protein
MPCLLLILTLAFPRVVLVCLFLFSNYLERAYHGLILLLIGFIFLPITTITYAWLMNSHRPIEGAYLIILIVAVVLDVGSLGHGEYRRRQ